MSASNRNQPCTCGSGLKWKKCHGTPEAQAYTRQQQEKQEAEKRRLLHEKHYADLKAKGYEPPKKMPAAMLAMCLAAAIGQPYLRQHPLR